MARYLVTSALPYANGPLHFGHVIGAYLPADVYVRTLRMQGEEVLFVCGTDEHGVAITIQAEREGIPYERYVARWRDQIGAMFERFGIQFDVWSGTSVSPPHRELSQQFFLRLHEQGYLVRDEVEQHYCPTDRMFLPDRYLEGTCPFCGFERARGDECPRCGAWIDAQRLGSPRCKICGGAPELRPTTHYYLDLERLRDEHIGAWFGEKRWKPNVEAFVKNQLADVGRRPITRDLSWGVPLPDGVEGAGEGKVLYVWFDAPIGYVSFTRELADRRGDPALWSRFWRSEDTRLVHFIGKDNIPFHCLIFPSMLWGQKQGYVLPWQVPAMEFYNLQGRKFSTSERWTIPIDEHFERYDRDATRFHLLASAPETADSEWRWEEFQRTVDLLADALGNLATRVLRFVAKHHEGRVPDAPAPLAAELDRILFEECGAIADPADAVRDFRFRRACEDLLANASVGNVFVDRLAPWALRRTDPERGAAVLASACDWLALLARWSAPFMPERAQELWSMVGGEGPVAEQGWPRRPAPGEWRVLPAGRRLGEVRPLFEKIPPERVQAEVEALRARA